VISTDVAKGVTRDDLVAEWKATATHRGKAVLEERIWASLNAVERLSASRRTFLAALLGASQSATQLRQNLLYAPDELWERVADGMTLATARRLWASVRREARPFAEVLAEYDAAPGYVAKFAGGTTVKRRHMHQRVNGVPAETKRERKSWGGVHDRIIKLASDGIAGVPPLVAEKLLAELEAELKTAIGEFRAKLKNAKQRGKPEPERAVTRKRLVAACQRLGVQPPAPGGRPDMIAGKRAFRALSREYHPDRRGETTAELFRAVTEAWRTLQAYDEQQETSHGGSDGDERTEASA
jgi:hypothetical protein